MTYLIVIEAEGAAVGIYHYQPYRVASSVSEAQELMRDYMRRLETNLCDLVPSYFALYEEKGGEFGSPEFYDPETTQVADATKWLQETERI